MNELNYNNRNLHISFAFNSRQQISAQFDAQYAAIDQKNRENLDVMQSLLSEQRQVLYRKS